MSTKTRTILIVEDERPLSEALKITLEKEGYVVYVANNGEVGLSMALDYKPDVIVCDIEMPYMDGPHFITKLHENEWGKDSYTFVLTNYSDSSHIHQILNLGISTYFVKSDISIEKIVSHIKNYLENHSK